MKKDVICDIATEGLKPFADNSCDFIIASHVLEHIPNPLATLIEFFRVLKPGGVLYLGLPDKNFTFDRDRESTPLAHLIDDLQRGVTTVEEHHVLDYCLNAAKYTLPTDILERKQIFARELERSIHVHVWTWIDMVEMLQHMVAKGGTPFELLEMYLPKGVKLEAIFMLRKTEWAAKEAGLRFDASLRLLRQREQAIEAIICATIQRDRQFDELNKRNAELSRQSAEVSSQLSQSNWKAISPKSHKPSYLRKAAKIGRKVMRRLGATLRTGSK